MPDNADLLALIQRELQHIKPDAGEISADTDLVSDLNLDSVQVLEMCTAIEDELDVSIPVNKLGEVRTAGQLVAVLQDITAD